VHLYIGLTLWRPG